MMVRLFLRDSAAERRDAAALAAEARLDATRHTARDALDSLSGSWQGLSRWAVPERAAPPRPANVPPAEAAVGNVPSRAAVPVKAVVLAAAVGAIAAAWALRAGGRLRRG